MARPASQRKPGDGERLRLASATFVVADEEPRAIYKPALPPDPETPRDGLGAMPIARTKPTEVIAWSKPYSESLDQEDDGSPPQTLLDLLLDTRRGFVVLLWLAAGLGAAHALTPGHGKTLAAAYLVGERGTVWHALLLGLVTTVTHTAAVLALAVLLNVFFPNTSRVSVQTGLELVGGLLVTGLGLWLLLVRLAGQADHVHLGGSHDHVHSHGGHSHSLADLQPGWRGLVILGISGGIVPCWDAMAILAGTVAKQRLWMGPPLLLAFSAGLASVLVVVGITVVQAKKWAGLGLGDRTWFRRIERVLPLASAVVVTAMGVWLCYESLHPAGG
jgi:ABC-type nickel/cobalt efflux system permease component RcnA